MREAGLVVGRTLELLRASVSAGVSTAELDALPTTPARDPILGSADRALIEHVPGAKGQPHDRIRGGHFIQEDAGPELARRMIDWMS